MADHVFSDKALAQIEQMYREFQARLRNDRGPQATYSNTGLNIMLAKTTTAHDKGETETVDLYSGTDKGAETVTGNSPDAFNRYGDLETGKWCTVIFIGGAWELIAGEC